MPQRLSANFSTGKIEKSRLLNALIEIEHFFVWSLPEGFLIEL